MDHVELRRDRHGRPSVTRVFGSPLPLASAEVVRSAVFGGPVESLTHELAEAIAGYRVRATLGSFEGLPAIVDAGIAVFEAGVLAPLPDGSGYPYVTSEWIEGQNLGDVRSGLAVSDRLAIAAGVLRLLARVHGRGVVHGRIRPRSVVLVGTEAMLVGLDALREGDPASDMPAFGRLATWLLDPELTSGPASPEVAAWKPLVAACLHAEPRARPSSGALLAALRGPTDTVAVLDPPSQRTVFVPDPEARPRRRRSRAWVAALLCLVLAGGAGALVLAMRSREQAAEPAARRQGEPPFGKCQAEGRIRVVVATIHAREPVPHLPTIASWFPADIPPHEIEIHGVEEASGRSISFELSETGWSAWRDVVGTARGEEICWRVGAWLRQREAGREEGARPDLLSGPRPGARDQDLGTVAALPLPEAHQRLETFLNPSGLRTSCEVEPSRFGLLARCHVTSSSETEEAIRVVATLDGGDEPPAPQAREGLSVRPGESIEVRFSFDVTGDADEATCRCDATRSP